MTDKIDRLRKMDNNKLIDIVKNYRQYGYDQVLRNEALSILESRGGSKEQLQLTGNFENHNYDLALATYTSFSRVSKTALALYITLFAFNILIYAINITSASTLLFLVTVNWLVLFCYIFFLIRAFIVQNQFSKITGKDYGTEGAFIYLFVGAPFYLLSYFYFKKQMEEQLRLIK
jgi:hypothetical protein